MKRLIILLAVLATFATSCTKEEEARITGTWEIREVYNGYNNGGNFQWNEVPAEYRTTISFYDNGSYTISQPQGAAPSTCSGDYQLHSDNRIQLQMSCFSSWDYSTISGLTPARLELSRDVTEGTIREKYVRIN
jgi:hypothetical protein